MQEGPGVKHKALVAKQLVWLCAWNWAVSPFRG